MIRLLAIIAFSALSANAWAQFTLSGSVRRAEKKEALKGASVTLVELSRSTITDDLGNFSFSNLSPSTYTLLVKYIGFADYKNPISINTSSQIEVDLVESVVITDEVMISALRAKENTPTTYTNINKQTIAKQNFGQDMPFLLNWTPSLVTTSDAGAGIGYTGMRIRGSDATQLNVTINGIPYNDSESQSVYWVDIPDVASSTESIQVQRGVGTSTNGAGAFGASVNLQTNSLQKDPYAEVSGSYGSFNSQKYTIKAGTGLINGVWAFDGRISKIKSDGYIERATSDLDSYYLSGGYYGKKTIVKAILFGGHETTYQSWYGTDPDRLKMDRRFNYAGALYDSTGQVSGYYDRQVDDYGQDNYQLHFSHLLSDAWNINAAVHYTHGSGYFEEYMQGQSYTSMGLQNVVVGSDTISSGDFITRQWLDNKFYGTTFSANYSRPGMNFTFGGAANRYGNAKHYGEIIWAEFAGTTPMRYHYYDAVSQKDDYNAYAKLNYDLAERVNGFLDIQYRGVTYKSSGLADDLTPYDIDDHFNFFNPKAGVSYTLSGNDVLYSSYAIAHREPTRADYLGGSEKPRSEQLGNLETGWRRSAERYRLEVNYYLMNYHDQLVLTGQLNSGGYPIRANVGKSYRTGIEISGSWKMTDRLTWNANVTYSHNKNIDIVDVNSAGTPVTHHNTDIILSPNWIAGSQLLWSVIKRTELGLLTKYVGDQYLDNTQQASVRMDSYFINDIRITHTLNPSFMKGVDIGVLVNNIFDIKYSSNGAVYSGVPYYYPQAGRNYLLRFTARF